MYFTYLEAENFLSIGQVQLPLSLQGLMLVVGENLDDPSAESNGSGKSALPEAIFWCLYGKTLRGVKYVDSVVNRTAKKNCRVKLSLNTHLGALTVERFRKHKDFKNAIHVHLNNEKMHSTDPRTTQRVLNKLLGMDADMFSRLVLIGQGFSQRFTDMDDRELKEFIEGMTGSLLYAKAHGVAKDKLTHTQGLKKGLEETKRSLEIQVSEFEQRVADEHALSTQAEQARQEVLGRLQAEIQQERSEIATIQARIQQTEAERSSNIAQYDKQIVDWQSHESTLNEQYTAATAKQAEEKAVLRRTQQNEIAEIDRAVEAVRAKFSTEAESLETRRAALVLHRENDVGSRAASREHLVWQRAQDREPLQNTYTLRQSEVNAFRVPEVPPALYASLATAQGRLKALDDRLAQAEAQIGTKCPQCGQTVTDDSVKVHILETFDPDRERSDIVTGVGGVKSCETSIEKAKVRVAEQEVFQSERRGETHQAHQNLQTLIAQQEAEIKLFDAETANVPANHNPKIQEVDLQIAEIRGKQDAEVKVEESERSRLRAAHDQAIGQLDTTHQQATASVQEEIRKARGGTDGVRSVRDKYVSDVDSVLNQQRGEISTHERLVTDKDKETARLNAHDLFVALRTLEAGLQDVQVKVADSVQKISEADSQEYLYEYLTTAFGLGGIRSYMMDSILSYLNERLKSHCQYLFDSRVQIELSPVMEQKNKSIVDKITLIVSTPGQSYDTASGGERRKVDVALFLAFRDLNRSLSPIQVNLEAYDEILSFLDGESASRVVQLLVADQSVETKILITHRADVPVIGPHRVIKAVKQLGVTSYHAA